MTLLSPNHTIITCRPRTLKRPISYSGIGIHTGQLVTMRFCPAEEGTGILFKRIDLRGHPIIPATVEYVCDTSRSTTIGVGSLRIHTIEHVLAALSAYRIHNLCIEIDNIEPPVANGSSDAFVQMIEEAELDEQEGAIPIAKVLHPIYHSEGDIHLVALPHDHFRISYTLSYPEIPALKAQYHSLAITPENFKREIASCRTFSLYEEVSFLMDRGLIKGGSLDNAVVIQKDAIFSKNGLFFPDEMVRHKILDIVGDLSLVGYPFQAHIIAIRSGHASNYAFAKKLYQHITGAL